MLNAWLDMESNESLPEPAAVPTADSAVEKLPPPCYTANSARFDLTPAGLAAWARSPEFRSVLAFAKSYDAYHSLQSDNSRALLYHLVTTLRPECVLEIGTFRAGTARFLAQALRHAGRGVLHTIDPFGIENKVPAIINSWPVDLQAHVQFSPISSATFFAQAMTEGLIFDLVLIDGNHEYEYAAFDLACAARLMNAGGVVVLDNVDQPGPRYATQNFLIANPGWKEVSGAAAEPLMDDAAVAQLPALSQTSNCRLAWEVIEGLTVSKGGPGPAPNFFTLKLEAVNSGLHRLGIHFIGLAPNRKYRLAIWLGALHSANVMVDVRDFADGEFANILRSSQTGCPSPNRINLRSLVRAGWR